MKWSQLKRNAWIFAAPHFPDGRQENEKQMSNLNSFQVENSEGNYQRIKMRRVKWDEGKEERENEEMRKKH